MQLTKNSHVLQDFGKGRREGSSFMSQPVYFDAKARA